MSSLAGQVALVTGASRGVGKGVAVGLANAGATVYATGRSVAHATLPNGIAAVPCDHTDDESVTSVFERIAREHGRIDVLVNSAWGGYERMVEDDRFTWADPFWKQPVWRWDAMITAGVRAAFVASQHAARLMVAVAVHPRAESGLLPCQIWVARAPTAWRCCGRVWRRHRAPSAARLLDCGHVVVRADANHRLMWRSVHSRGSDRRLWPCRRAIR